VTSALVESDPRLPLWLSLPSLVRVRIVGLLGRGWRDLPYALLARIVAEFRERAERTTEPAPPYPETVTPAVSAGEAQF
jgi:hypothetical protein